MLNIVITTAPSGDASLAEEVRLAKPALLYGDKITLYSPTAALLLSIAHIGELDDEGVVDFLESLAPTFGPQLAILGEQYRSLAQKRRRTREELQQLTRIRIALRRMAGEVREKADEAAEAAGAGELIPAIEAGLVEIDPLVMEEHADDDDLLFKSYMDKLRGLLTGRLYYPLFDEQTGSLVRAAVGEGMFDLGATARRRGKQAATAADYIVRVPAFPAATIAEVLDIRKELEKPLVRFRSVIAELSRKIEAAAHEQDFEAEAAELYASDVEPVLLDLRETVESNTTSVSCLGELERTQRR